MKNYKFLKPTFTLPFFAKKYFQKWYQLLWCDFWLKNYKVLKSMQFVTQKCWRHEKFCSQNFLWEIFRKFLWLPSFGTSFSFLTSLLTTLRGAGHFEPPPQKKLSHSQKSTVRIGLTEFYIESSCIFKKSIYTFIYVYIRYILSH